MLNLTDEMLNGELTTVWYQLGDIIPPSRFRFALYSAFLLYKAKGGTVCGAEWDEEKEVWKSADIKLEHLFNSENEALISYYTQRKEYALRMMLHHKSNANYELARVEEFDDLFNEIANKLSTLKGDAK